ncbi:MAG: pyridoxamine 5'-phosphate oxidase family protein [Alphaproteobacteria bacterium]|nr:pyridoxamine 5'-phosphate oxidase family protein [Alphaproteobacteria bacterium]
MDIVASIAELETIYGAPSETALVKVSDHVTKAYAQLIAASPFAILATVGPEGLDCSPRGDGPGFVRLGDPRTLLMPDRRGNNRIDSLRNIVRDPRVALLFLIPGMGTTLRVNGTAQIARDEALCHSFAVEGHAPRSVIVIEVREVYFQCARAIVRSHLWSADHHVDPKALPSPGEILASLSDGRIGGARCDEDWPARAKASLW